MLAVPVTLPLLSPLHYILSSPSTKDSPCLTTPIQTVQLSPPILKTEKELLSSLKSIGWDLEDLSETISLVEENPSRFKISSQELAERKQFVKETTKKVADFRSHITSSDSKAKIAAGSRKVRWTATLFAFYCQ